MGELYKRFSCRQYSGARLTFLTIYLVLAPLATAQTPAVTTRDGAADARRDRPAGGSNGPASLERASARLAEQLRKVAFSESIFTPAGTMHSDLYGAISVRSATLRGCVLTLEEDVRVKTTIVRDESQAVETIVDRHPACTYVIDLADAERPAALTDITAKPVTLGQRSTPDRWEELTVRAAPGRTFEEQCISMGEKPDVRAVTRHMLKLGVADRALATDLRGLLNEVMEACAPPQPAK